MKHLIYFEDRSFNVSVIWIVLNFLNDDLLESCNTPMNTRRTVSKPKYAIMFVPRFV